MKLYHINDFSPYAKIFPELSCVQLKVLILYVNLYKIDHIALTLDIKTNTVCEHLKRIKEKYQVNSLFELKLLFNNRMQCFLLNFINRLTF